MPMRRLPALLTILLALGGCVATPTVPTADDPLAARVCQTTRDRLAQASPATPQTAALAARLETECDALGRDYAAALREAAVIGAVADIPPLRRPPAEAAVTDAVLWADAATVERFYGGDGGTTPAGRPVVWVTLAPELRDWCRTLDWSEPASAYQRVSQRLGLPPWALNDRFVLLSVAPDRLLRPCADPDPGQTACGPAVAETVAVPDLTRDAYTAWFAANVGGAYRPEGAPWTRYGWTYDWGADAATPPYGASEFLLAPATGYRIDGVVVAEEYCAP